MTYLEELALLYVKERMAPNDSPITLLNKFLEAYEQMKNAEAVHKTKNLPLG